MANGRELKKQAGLEYLELGNADAAVTIVILHGYGADAFDLSGLAHELKMGKPVRWIFPQGPLTVPLGMGFWGRAWFPIDMARHEAAAQLGEGVDYSQVRPKGVDQARDLVLKFLKQLAVPLQNVILGGFSQGAMLGVDVISSLEVSPRAAVLLSGVLADEAGLKARALAKQGLRFFQSHGSEDQILPISGARQLEQVLLTAGWQGSLYEFNGGHELPAGVLRQLQSFLREVI